LTLGFRQQLDAGLISTTVFRESLLIQNFVPGFGEFLTDPAHIYVILGGFLLGMSISIGRWKIILLKDEINELFGTYVDRGIRDRIMTKGRTSSERKRMCVLFSDIPNFTSKSESHNPEDLTEMLNRYFTEWDETVSHHNGIIDKFIGDAVMVLFDDREDAIACSDAVRCADEMLRMLPELDEGLRSDGLPTINAIGIGIHLGDVVVGDIGSLRRKNYTVIGDNVNIASRLEGMSKNTPATIVVSDDVFTALGDELRKNLRSLGNVKLRGKSENIHVYGNQPQE
jgi:class 3 adenylate cyclase